MAGRVVNVQRMTLRESLAARLCAHPFSDRRDHCKVCETRRARRFLMGNSSCITKVPRRTRMRFS